MQNQKVKYWPSSLGQATPSDDDSLFPGGIFYNKGWMVLTLIGFIAGYYSGKPNYRRGKKRRKR